MSTGDNPTKLDLLKQNALASDVRSALAQYLSVTGLERALSGDEWTVRALPSTGARAEAQRLFTVNVSNMETFFSFYNPKTSEDLGGQLNVWHELRDSLPRLERDYGIEELPTAPYKAANGKGVMLWYWDLQQLRHLLADSEITSAASRLVSYLRSHGQVPSIQRRWHDRRFAAWIKSGEVPTDGVT